jgi:TonB family protein
MENSASQLVLFSLLPKQPTPWSEFFLSYSAQAVAVAIFISISLLNPAIMRPPDRDYKIMGLVSTPAPVNHTPQKQLPRPLPVVAKIDPPPAALHLPAPQPKPKLQLEDTPAPEIKVAENKPAPLPVAEPAIPRKVVRVNTFSTGSSAPQTIVRAPEKVQTGGFGDPNGVAAKLNTPGHVVNIAQAGGFDMPTGPGVGNGTGGAKGASGVVASAGFGNGTALVDNRPAFHGTVRTAGFGDADVPAPPTANNRPAQSVTARIIPAEILSKPVPIYTEEARRMRIEGEVLVQAVLEASGRVQVLKIVHGLGHGLDEEAVRKAAEIRFKPATRDGQPSDSTVVLHIIFQLA